MLTPISARPFRYKKFITNQYSLYKDRDHTVLRPQKRGCLLGTGTWGGGGGGERGAREQESESSTADTARKKTGMTVDRHQNNGVLRRCPLAIAQRLVHRAIAVSNCRAGQSHKDNVRCTAVEEQPEATEVQLSQPSSTSLLMISSGLT